MSQASSDIVTIQGPLWSAQARLLDLAHPQQNKALRTLFLEHVSNTANPAYRPGTVITLCDVRQVTVRPGGTQSGESYVWKQTENRLTEPLPPDRIRELLKTGRLSLLLLSPDYKPNKPNDKPTRFTCLTGEIYLNRLHPEANARHNLFSHLPLAPVADVDQVQSRLDARNRASRNSGEKLASELSVHSSGLSIYAQVILPWKIAANQANPEILPLLSEQTTTISSPFQLTQQFIATAEQILLGDLQLTLDRERLTPTEEHLWIKLWQALIQQLNPRHPLYGRKTEKNTTAEINDNTTEEATNSTAVTTYPNWVTLEFPNPNRVPRLWWRINQQANTSMLNLQADEVYIVLSDRALYDLEPPTSLARIIPSDVTLRFDNRADQQPQIILEIKAKEVAAELQYDSHLPKITYRFNATDVKHGAEETLSASHLKTTFSPVETPQFIRQTQNLPTPEWSSGDQAHPVEPAVVLGFMPLENGWAQLPVPNLTEQIYLDSESNQEPEVDREPQTQNHTDPPIALVQGALSLGNDRHAVLSHYANEQPWSLTITDADALQGTWTLTIEGSSLKLTAISLELQNPAVILNGFFWLSTGQPRLQDALPDLDNWVAGLRSIPLKTVSPQDLFPSVMLLEWPELTLQVRADAAMPSAALKPWQFSYTIDPDNLKELTDKKVLPKNIFRDELPSTLPLIWQRHPYLPMIQALPLTQNQLPANYPSASRQLVPYELDAISVESPRPQEWRFAVTSNQGAEVWPNCIGKTLPAKAWQETFDLPLVSLSVPGLVLEPSASIASNDGANPALLLQYRFDLPYTDEVNALAQLPKEPVQPEQVSPLPDSTPPASLQPLTRETFAQHWQHLSTLASLSMADAVNALETPLLSEYDLALISRARAEDLPTAGRSLVVVAKIGDSYHARIFDCTGTLVLDKGNGEFSPDGTLVQKLDAALRNSLENKPTDASTKHELIQKVTSSLNYTFKEPVLIQNLIEPLEWPVQIGFNLTTYPGTINLQNGFSSSLTGTTALKGISGDFYVNEQKHLTGTAQPRQTAYRITAGSLAAHLEADEMRDQRGLFRSATVRSEGFLQTRVRFQRQVNQIELYDLTTTLSSLTLQIGDDTNNTWQIWFRDLPLQITSTNNHYFIRSNIQSNVAKDINDPQARSRDHDFLSGYEWRLAAVEKAKTEKDLPYLPLLGLHFYPLTLDKVEASAGIIHTVVMTGRLQLPLSAANEAQELEDFSNAVQVTFKRNGNTLKLDAITISPGGLGEWPLALEQNELTNAPLLTWESVRLSASKDQLMVEGLQLKFFLFEQEWMVGDREIENQGSETKYETLIRWMSKDQKLTFSTSTDQQKGIYTFTSDNSPLSPKTLTIRLDLAQGKHSVDLELDIQLGKKGETQKSFRSAFSATVSFAILQAGTPLDSVALWSLGHLVNDLLLKDQDGKNPQKLEQNRLDINGQALQFQWSAYDVSEPLDEALQLLPGLELQQEGSQTTPGFAALTFAAIAQPDSRIPQLQLSSAFVETMLFCRWGESLQQNLAAPTPEQVFGSSAGDLVCGYTIQWQPDPLQSGQRQSGQRQSGKWVESLLLNGVLEIKNLISWPKELTLQTEANRTLVTLPPRQTEDAQPQPFAHLRHTLRILFNQHHIPDDLLDVGDDNLLFQLKPDAVWQFQAVVEHQLLNVSGLSSDALMLKHDRRWTTVQEVRWLSPKRFKSALSDLQKANILDSAWNNTDLGVAAGGYLEQRLSALLTEGKAAPLDRLHKTLLVESSAHHWIHQTAIQDKSATTLQFLPNGSQLGILSSPDDYGSSDPNDPQWLLLTLPFLGRLQSRTCDRLDLLQAPRAEMNEGTNTEPLRGLDTSSAHPLQVDPILHLAAQLPEPEWALIFASWGDKTSVKLAVSDLDGALGSTWSRLDSASLEESWFRLQHPLREASPTVLQSVLAALPDNPARLSRSLALKDLARGNRTSYPPSRSTNSHQTDRDESNRRNDSAAQPNPLIWQPNHLLVAPNLRQTTEGLEVLYTFQKDAQAENLVRDVSGVGDSLDLSIRHLNHVEWISGGGLRIKQPTLICSIRAADKIIKACQGTQEITIEVWLKPVSKTLRDGNPARIVTLSQNTGNRNFTLGQGISGHPSNQSNNAYLVRLRTSKTDDNATAHKHQEDAKKPGPVVYAASPLVQPNQLVHVVFTRSKKDPIARIYIDGKPADIALERGTTAKHVQMPGDFSSWNALYYLALANEVSFHEQRTENHRSWLGEYYQVAIYSRALSDGEVSQHYQLGPKAVPQQSVSYAWAVPGIQLVSSKLAGFSHAEEAQTSQNNGSNDSSNDSSPNSNQAIPLDSPSDSPSDSPPDTSRYGAATLLPSQLPHNPQPVSLAVSPYLSLEFHPVLDPQAYQLQLMAVELLCLDPVRQSLLPIASYFWENKAQGNSLKLQTLNDILLWARETHLRLCPNSPVAILRSREIRRLPDQASAPPSDQAPPQNKIPPLVTTYDYAVVTDIQSVQTLAKRVFRLRSEIAQLHFREGQCGGLRLPPANLHAFELAPPQTIGVQPLHLIDRPLLPATGDGKSNQVSVQWPWGMSALRISLQYGEGQQGIVGEVKNQVKDQPDAADLPSAVTLWWQAPQHSVQYRTSGKATEDLASPTQRELPAAGLPAQFRARAIQSFLPTSLNPPMPTVDLAGLLNWQGEAIQRWQPVLPGQLRYLMIGNRPGVMHAIRNQLLRQSQPALRQDLVADPVLVSGSLPVQHRMPRPVPLPPNTNRQNALQPWASYFEPMQNLMVTDAPADEAFYGEVIVQTGAANQENRKPAQRLQMRLIAPERGAISSQWDGTLKFSISADVEASNQSSTPEQWEFAVTLADDENIIGYNPPQASGSQIYEVTPQDQETPLQALLKQQTPGSLLIVQAKVMPKTSTDNFKQTLTFPLRLIDETALPLPLKPQFIYFEDPEYNRRLASPAAHASQAVQVPAGSANAAKLVEVKLSADRREYNPDSVLSLRYDWVEPIPDGFTAELLFRRINPDGPATNLKISDSALATQAQALPQGRLFQISLLMLQIKPEGEDWKPALRPDDGLEVSLTVRHNQVVKATVNLPLNVVATPVNPAPEAAYALLRRSESRVECVRFAWGPIPSQVELVNADDLRTEVVRRRAVFRWTDSVRPNTAVSYAIQKITQTGSTHFPTLLT